MDNTLLIIYDFNLRQLYHELLLSKNIEIIPTTRIENAILMITLMPISHIVIYFDNTNKIEIDAFLSLRKKFHKWQEIHMILLIIDQTFYHPDLTPKDTIISIEQLTPEEASEKIKSSILL